MTAEGDWKITTDNILVKAKGEGITPERSTRHQAARLTRDMG
jgi:hypothetical protein